MGKTNVLDAIYYLCMTRSYFGLRDRHLVRHNQSFFRLEAQVKQGAQTRQVVAKVAPGQRKEFELDGTIVPKRSDYIGTFPVVIVAPADTQLAYEGSEVRRKLLDAALAQTDKQYLAQLVQFARLLKQRNSLLRQLANHPKPDLELLHAIDYQLHGPSKFIHHRRKQYIEALNPLLQYYYKQVAPQDEQVSCHYKSQLLYSDIETLLARKRSQDLALGYSTAGIQRDDLDFRIDGRPLKQFASQGQLKSFILALKLAQYQLLCTQRHLYSLLLLDDLFDKLDEHRVTQLLCLLLSQEFGQVFITDTDHTRVPAIIRNLNHTFVQYEILQGTARPIATSSAPNTTEDE